jgi:polyferredoxin
LHHFFFLRYSWTLGIDSFQNGDINSLEIAWNMLLRFFLPLALIVGSGIFISWKWGRLYCGWLCPHFSVVEMINGLMRRASGKLSLWDKKKLPELQQDGKEIHPHKSWWVVTAIAVVLFSFVWAVALLTYLLPPKEIYSNLFTGNLTRNQSVFIVVATSLFIIEFTLARHFFCRFGCAIGLFQSLVWMGNKKALVVSHDRSKGKECADCDASCEHACPMRLKPRGKKRHMFTCTQCMQCVEACETVQIGKGRAPLLKMLQDQCALDASARDFGHRPEVPEDCFGTKGNSKK